MGNKIKKRRHYTFMIIPHDPGARTVGFKIPVFWIYLIIISVVFSVGVVGSSLVYSTVLSRRLIHYSNTIAKNEQQQQVITSFRGETEKLNYAVEELIKEDDQLRKLLGMETWKGKIRLSTALKDNNPQTDAEKVSYEFKVADMRLTERKNSFEELKSWVNDVRQRYATTPSSWPIHGRIVSRFGYRIYPWRGFHTGLDISGHYGAPVRATADGMVSFVGWKRGYGKTVVIKHDHGYSTLFAHSSRFAVKVGQPVSKGQIVCYVGNTGYTTGPHLHYEVRKFDKPINPASYLDLNILTASRIWRK
jgi:murein DD-endopeptidase MepM/ murein hydrolase activator NlpD